MSIAIFCLHFWSLSLRLMCFHISVSYILVQLPIHSSSISVFLHLFFFLPFSTYPRNSIGRSEIKTWGVLAPCFIHVLMPMLPFTCRALLFPFFLFFFSSWFSLFRMVLSLQLWFYWHNRYLLLRCLFTAEVTNMLWGGRLFVTCWRFFLWVLLFWRCWALKPLEVHSNKVEREALVSRVGKHTILHWKHGLKANPRLGLQYFWIGDTHLSKSLKRLTPHQIKFNNLKHTPALIFCCWRKGPPSQTRRRGY